MPTHKFTVDAALVELSTPTASAQIFFVAGQTERRYFSGMTKATRMYVGFATLLSVIVSTHVQGDQQAPATTQSAEKIGVGDKLSISLNDLVAVGVVSILTPVVDKNGEIKLPLIGNAKVDGLTADEAQKKIADAYKNAQFITNAQVGVSWVEHAGE